jgi:hypothetical protein
LGFGVLGERGGEADGNGDVEELVLVLVLGKTGSELLDVVGAEKFKSPDDTFGVESVTDGSSIEVGVGDADDGTLGENDKGTSGDDTGGITGNES